jgi:hypothetical protein
MKKILIVGAALAALTTSAMADYDDDDFKWNTPAEWDAPMNPGACARSGARDRGACVTPHQLADQCIKRRGRHCDPRVPSWMIGD